MTQYISDRKNDISNTINQNNTEKNVFLLFLMIKDEIFFVFSEVFSQLLAFFTNKNVQFSSLMSSFQIKLRHLKEGIIPTGKRCG
jgi:dipeptide/tripeptide permease